MTELQNEVKACICQADEFLSSPSHSSEEDVNSFICHTYRNFLKYAWCELPVSNADGSALATVSCMSLWELLNEYTSASTAVAPQKKGLAVQVLTSMYPKCKDRRCIFQQLNCAGTNAATSVPLSTHLPLELNVPVLLEGDHRQSYVNAVRRIVNIAQSGSYLDGKEAASIAAATREFVSNVLPNCVLAKEEESRSVTSDHKIYICLGKTDFSWNSGFFLFLAIWNFLMVGNFLGLREAKELTAFLRSSQWSSQSIGWASHKLQYRALFSPLTDVSALCVALNPRTAPASVDIAPLIDPRVVLLLCGSGAYPCVQKFETKFETTQEQKSLSESKLSLVEKKAAVVDEQLNSDIPEAIQWMGFSASCRDFDQLAYLCRDLVFSAAAKDDADKAKLAVRRRDLLFNRKRRRDGGSCDGPCFIPVQSSISSVMEKGSAVDQVTLERLCCKWSAK